MHSHTRDRNFGKNFGREHSVAVRNRCWVQDGLWSDQSCPLPTLTHQFEPNDRSQFVISKKQSSLFAITLTFAYTTRLTPTFGPGILFACFCRGPRPKVKYAFLDRAFRLRNLADFATEIYFGREKPELANAPILLRIFVWFILTASVREQSARGKPRHREVRCVLQLSYQLATACGRPVIAQWINLLKGVMTWAKVTSLVCIFWSLPWTNGPNTQFKWKLRYSPIQCAYLEPSMAYFSDRQRTRIGLEIGN